MENKTITTKLKLLLLTSVVVLLITPAAAKADPIVLTLNPPSQTGTNGGLVTFQGTFSNGGEPFCFVNSVSFTLVGNPAGFTFDPNEFFSAVPQLVDGGFSIGATNFFIVFIDSTVTPGLYSGSFSVLGGSDEVDESLLVSQEFTIEVNAVTSQVPEPASLLFLASGLSGLATLFRRRGRNSQ